MTGCITLLAGERQAGESNKSRPGLQRLAEAGAWTDAGKSGPAVQSPPGKYSAVAKKEYFGGVVIALFVGRTLRGI
jgi:hypothetical protein